MAKHNYREEGTSVDYMFDAAGNPVMSRAAKSNATTAAYATSLVLKATAGTLFGIAGYNSGPDQFVQLHDAAALPADAVVPVGPIVRVPAASNFSIDFGQYGMSFATGIVVCNSSTGPAKTIGAADLWISGRYL